MRVFTSGRSLTALLILMIPAAPAIAVDEPGLRFEHGDWAVSCDNTRTCRADGYQSDEGEQPPVSVLLTRAAGAGQAVKGELTLGNYDEDEAAAKSRPKTFALTMTIDGKSLGSVGMQADEMHGALSDAQVTALIASLARKSRIAWSYGGKTWRLSGNGGAAVLLKMDEAQGRLGTHGALIRKGTAGEEHVLSAWPKPLVVAVKPIDQDESEKRLSPAESKSLRTALLASIKPDDCPEPTEHPAETGMSVARLDARKQVASMVCWRGAYQSSASYWLTNRKPPWSPVLVADSGTDYNDGEINSALIGRGLGDCWSTETWTWDGSAFVHTASATSGMCKLVTAGGAWDLPTIVTDVRHAK